MKTKNDKADKKKFDTLSLSKGREKHLLKLHEWVNIIQSIYPNTTIENPYQKRIIELSEQLNVKEQLLFQALIKSLTLINKRSRQTTTGKLITAEADVINALELILPKEKKLNKKAVETYHKLQENFQNQAFTQLDAALCLRTSKTTLTRHFAILKHYNLLEKLQAKDFQKAIYKLKENQAEQQALETLEENIFETAMEEYNDFKGFLDANQRT